MAIRIRTAAQRNEATPTLFVVEATEDEFKSAVLGYVYELNRWLGHMRRVKDDEARGVAEAERHQAYPPPHPDGALAELVRQCIKIDDDVASADYDIVPPPAPDAAEVFEAKRKALLDQLRQAETAAQAGVLHPNKARLFNLKSATALRTPEDQRTDEHRALIERGQRYVKQHEAIAWHFARQEAAIADLTGETIDAFKVTPFNG